MAHSWMPGSSSRTRAASCTSCEHTMASRSRIYQRQSFWAVWTLARVLAAAWTLQPAHSKALLWPLSRQAVSLSLVIPLFLTAISGIFNSVMNFDNLNSCVPEQICCLTVFKLFVHINRYKNPKWPKPPTEVNFFCVTSAFNLLFQQMWCERTRQLIADYCIGN